ncbi:NlpC/P60 family protein (plasmid) [Piscirickettsia salmonis]|uniref:NlpC/P60 family protein n=1 Tax=Piscirickettsia salmonis TaxID=1238 RepID=UPI0012D89488|nr:NlpC/P60 family protein [Piscirickettsia salmonis]QGP57460.1 NlpC/P60 family protein [Piscirickettsia salmonis]
MDTLYLLRGSKALNLFKAYALEQYPKEAVGLILPADHFMPCPNLSITPEESFCIDPTQLIDTPSGTLLIHSHPDGTAEPSLADMVGQRDTGLLWGIVALNQHAITDAIVFGEQLFTQQLLERPFLHGIFDCYSLIRDFYAVEKKIFLPDFPRQRSWWEIEKYNLYERYFTEAGFIEVDKASPLHRGDVLLMRVGRTTCINHGAIYLGEDCRLKEDRNTVSLPGMILHHLCDNLSRREMLSEWQKRIAKVVRYEN